MVTIEQVEKLREYANVSYDEAKAALESTGGDMLQAIIDLEHQGKMKTPEGGGKFVSNGSGRQNQHQTGSSEKTDSSKKNEQGNTAFKENVNRFFRWVGGIIHKGNMNALVVEKSGEQVIKLPVTALVILLLCAFWIVVPLLVLGLFFSFRYYFSGPDLGSNSVNDALQSASNAAEEIKNDINKS